MQATARTQLTLTEAAEINDVPRRSVARAAERGQIPSERIGNFIVVDAEAARLYGEVHKARRVLDEYTGRASAEAGDA
jgi:hypothetical protein